MGKGLVFQFLEYVQGESRAGLLFSGSEPVADGLSHSLANAQLAESREALLRQKEQIESQKKHLEEVDKSKTRFYTNLAHDFRSPLSLILGASSDLLKHSNLTTTCSTMRLNSLLTEGKCTYMSIHKVRLKSRNTSRSVNRITDRALERRNVAQKRRPKRRVFWNPFTWYRRRDIGGAPDRQERPQNRRRCEKNNLSRKGGSDSGHTGSG